MEVVVMNKEKDVLLSMLDRGIDDMESGREFPVNEALEKVNLIREMRKREREKSASNQ